MARTSITLHFLAQPHHMGDTKDVFHPHDSDAATAELRAGAAVTVVEDLVSYDDGEVHLHCGERGT
eukprot:gene8058-21084_t